MINRKNYYLINFIYSIYFQKNLFSYKKNENPIYIYKNMI